AFPQIAARCPSRRPVAREPPPSGGLLAAKRWIAVTSWVVCSIVKGPSPHSVPNRSPYGSILRDRGSESVPVRSPNEFLSVPGERHPPNGTRVPVRDACAAVGNSMGTRPERIGICVATDEAADQGVPHFDRYG